MKNYKLKLLALAVSVNGLATWLPATETEATDTAIAFETEIREEVTSLRERLLKLEAMLDSIQSSPKADAATTAAPQPAENDLGSPELLDPVMEAMVESSEPEATIAILPNSSTSWPTAVSDVEPDEEEPVGVASSGGQAISITGLLDTYYTVNSNNPVDGVNSLYYTNPNSRGFGLNQAKLEIDASGDGPIGFRSDIWFGSGARLFRDGLEPGPLADVIYLQQAYGYYQFGNGAELDVGLFGTIAGLEVAESHLNWNYTRGILWAWNEPFSHLGAKLSVPLSDTFTATVMLVNGFDNAFDTNTGKSYGLQGSYAPNDRFNTTFTWINGPENAFTNEAWQKDFSWNFYAGLHDCFEVMANLDYIEGNAPMEASATSWGVGLYGRIHLSDKIRIAERFEFFEDTQARSTGVAQNLRENTITFEVQPVRDDPRFLTRFEFRRDWSDVPFFLTDKADVFKRDQNTFTVGMMWVFGPKE